MTVAVHRSGNFRFGSLGDMAGCLVDVRSSPKSGHQAAVLQSRFVPTPDITADVSQAILRPRAHTR